MTARSCVSALLLMAIVCLSAPALAQLSPTADYAGELQDFAIPPQTALHTAAPHAPTPLVLPGASRITTAELYALLSEQQPMLLLYVNEAQDGLGISGSQWLDGAGRGQGLDDIVQARLMQKVDQLAGGNRAAPIVVYCFDAQCWLSYNAALHLVRAGFTNVAWYRGGREAWKAAGLPLVQLTRAAWQHGLSSRLHRPPPQQESSHENRLARNRYRPLAE
jgi:PQQ-dependent catabolism-associated CXXCW motif protein